MTYFGVNLQPSLHAYYADCDYPNEVTRWLSGEHNFTISTIAMLSAFFGESIITV